MKIRQDVADMLRAGHSDRAIARELHTDDKYVSRTRAALGLPKARSGKKPAPTLESAFLRHAQKTRNGHMRWTTHVQADGSRAFRWQGRGWTAGQAAFEIAHGRPAIGKALPVCGEDWCIAPAHMQDRAGRFQLATDMLTAGRSVSAAARTYQVDAAELRSIRNRLGIPLHPPGAKAASIDDTFRRRAVPTEDGHLLWPSSDYRIRTAEGIAVSAARIAFRQQYRRAPIGKVQPGCGTPRCVHPAHVEDQPMRTQFSAILGGAQ
ncbi:hypothetical protein ACGF1Z_31370 [Streptomyces sp. NPDC048018]|uniref:hypothetical protein n=1 Tax=Streptomyces sp. NPDC048018 TaxID=3365499 RepID=UPI00371F3D2E